MTDHPSFSLPSRLGSLCSDKLLMNFARPSNLTDIMEYGFQDLGDHFHTDVVLFPKSGDPVSIHSILLCTASPLLSSILSTMSTPQLQQTILLPEADSLTLTAMCQLLYGSAVLLSGDEISRLNHLLDTLNITMNISVLNSVHITGLRTSSTLPSELQSLNSTPELQSLHPHSDLQPLSPHSDLQPLNPHPDLHPFSNSSQDDPQHPPLKVQVTRRRKQILENSGTSRGSRSFQIGDTDCSLTIPADVQLNQTEQLEGISGNRSLSLNSRNGSENAPVSSNPPEVFILPDSQLLQPDSVQNISYGEDLVDERNPVQNSVSLTHVAPVESQSSGGTLAADSRRSVGALAAESRGSGGAKCLDPVLEQLEETVQTSGEGLPLLCWHCSEEFTTFKLLSEHVEQLTHTKHPRKHHRCPRCGDVLTSMWKLRQHLAQHQTSQFVGKGDHPYAEKKTKRIQTKKHCTRSGDHGYATATQLNTKLVPKPDLTPELPQRGSRRILKKVPNAGNHEELLRGDSKWRNGRVLKRIERRLREGEGGREGVREEEGGWEGVREAGKGGGEGVREAGAKGMTVSKEHSYGTQRDSSPDHDQMDVEERIDHPYSVISTINQSINSSPQQLFSEYVPRVESNNVINSGNRNESQRAGLLENRSIVENSTLEPLVNNSEGERVRKNRKAGLLENRSIVENSKRQEQEAEFINNSLPRGRTRSPRGVTKDEVKPQIFNCEICRKSFPANYRLIRHVREVHIKEKTHKCDQCSREFFKTANLYRHIVSVHHGIRPYACSHCFVGFKDTTALRYHTDNAVCQKHKNTAALQEDMAQSWI